MDADAMSWRAFLFSFDGKVTRRAFWLWWLALGLVVAVPLVSLSLSYPAAASYFGLLALPALWPNLCVGVKRAKDAGGSGRFVLVLLPMASMFSTASILLHAQAQGGGSSAVSSAAESFLLWLSVLAGLPVTFRCGFGAPDGAEPPAQSPPGFGGDWDALKDAFVPAVFSMEGRLGRGAFLGFSAASLGLFLLLPAALAAAVALASAKGAHGLPSGDPIPFPVRLLIAAGVSAFLWSAAALMVKRLHDMARSGLWSLLLCLPVPPLFLLAAALRMQAETSGFVAFVVLSLLPPALLLSVCAFKPGWTPPPAPAPLSKAPDDGPIAPVRPEGASEEGHEGGAGI